MKKLLLTLLLASFVLPACKDEKEESAGPLATSSEGSVTVDSVALEQVLQIMESDVAVLTAIDCEPPCEGALTDEQEGVLHKLELDVVGALQSGGESDNYYGLERYKNFRNLRRLNIEMEADGVTQASLGTWLNSLPEQHRQDAARTILIFINAYAVGSDLKEPFSLIASSDRSSTGRATNRLISTVSFELVALVDCAAVAVTAGAVAAGTAVVGGVGYAAKTGFDYLTSGRGRRTEWECLDFVGGGWFDGLDEICCGYRCTSSHGFLGSDPLTCEPVGSVQPTDNPDADYLDDCDEGTLVLPDMGMPEHDMGVIEADGGEVPMENQPQEG
jgi:hypothetical protein